MLRPADVGDAAPALLDQVLRRALGARVVVDVHVADVESSARPPSEDDRDAARLESLRQHLVVDHADQQNAIDVPAREVLLEADRVGLRPWREKDHLESARGKLIADSAEESRKGWIAKDGPVGVEHDHSDGLTASRRDGPRRAIRYVAKLGGGLLDGAARVRADL